MIYFDNNATTPIHPKVLQVIRKASIEYWANPSSVHKLGRKAFAKLEEARNKIAEFIGAEYYEIFFTSGGTESNNIAILGVMENNKNKKMAISSIEHPSVYDTSVFLRNNTIDVLEIPVDSNGIVKIEELKNILSNLKDIAFVSIMYANNEIGTIQPIREIGELCASYGIIFHTDAVQAFGKIPINVKKDNISLMSISSHKIYGPKGIGAVYIKKGIKIIPRFFGGYQEYQIRPGTQNLPAILGFVKAAEIAFLQMKENAEKLNELTDYFYNEIKLRIDNVILNGHPTQRVPGTINLCFPGAEAQSLIALLDQDDILVSAGSACSSGSISASRTLSEIGRRKQDALCSIRFSLGRQNTKKEVLKVISSLQRHVSYLRKINS